MRPLPHKKLPPVLYIAGGSCFLCRDFNSDQRSGDQGHLVDLLGIAAAGQVVDGGVQALENGAVGFKAAQALGNLVADVAGVDVGEDEGVGIAGDLGAGSLQLADLGSNRRPSAQGEPPERGR